MPSSVVNFLQTPDRSVSASSEAVATNTKNKVAGGTPLIPSLTKTTKRSGDAIAKGSLAKVARYDSATRSSLIQAAAGLLLVAKTTPRVPVQGTQVSVAAADEKNSNCQLAKPKDQKMGSDCSTSFSCGKVSRSSNLESLIEVTELDRKFMLYQPSSGPTLESGASTHEIRSLAGSSFTTKKRKGPIKQRMDKKLKTSVTKAKAASSPKLMKPHAASAGFIASVQKAAQDMTNNKNIISKDSQSQLGHIPTTLSLNRKTNQVPDGILSKTCASVDPQATLTATPDTTVNKRSELEVSRKTMERGPTNADANPGTKGRAVDSRYRLDPMTYMAVSSELNDLKAMKKTLSGGVVQAKSRNISLSKHFESDSRSINHIPLNQLDLVKAGTVAFQKKLQKSYEQVVVKNSVQANRNQVAKPAFRFPLPTRGGTNSIKSHAGINSSDIAHSVSAGKVQARNSVQTDKIQVAASPTKGEINNGESNPCKSISDDPHSISAVVQAKKPAKTNRIQVAESHFIRFPLPTKRERHEPNNEKSNPNTSLSGTKYGKCQHPTHAKDTVQTNGILAKKPPYKFPLPTRSLVQATSPVRVGKSNIKLARLTNFEFPIPTKDETSNRRSESDTTSAVRLQHRTSKDEPQRKFKWTSKKETKLKGKEALTPEEERERLRAYRCESTARHRAKKKEHRAELIERIEFFRSALGMPPRPATPPPNKSRAGCKRPNYNPPPEQMAKMTTAEISEWKRIQRIKRKREKTADLAKEENEKMLNLAVEHAQLQQLYKNSIADSDEK